MMWMIEVVDLVNSLRTEIDLRAKYRRLGKLARVHRDPFLRVIGIWENQQKTNIAQLDLKMDRNKRPIMGATVLVSICRDTDRPKKASSSSSHRCALRIVQDHRHVLSVSRIGPAVFWSQLCTACWFARRASDQRSRHPISRENFRAMRIFRALSVELGNTVWCGASRAWGRWPDSRRPPSSKQAVNEDETKGKSSTG